MLVARETIVEPGALWPSAHAASCVVLPDESLLATWFAGSREGAPDAAIWSAVYQNGAWSAPRMLIDTPGRSDGNSVLWFDFAGELHIWYVTMEGRGWATCPVRERLSGDLGRTWAEGRDVRRNWGWMVRNEPLWSAGRILMPMYDERDWSSFVLWSDNGGESWRESNRLRDGRGIIQPAIARTLDGAFLMFLRSRSGVIYRSRSRDGVAWSEPEATALPNPNSAVELIGLRSSALLSVYNASTSARSPLRVALSADGGETWDIWRDLEQGGGEYSYPTAVETSDGVIHVLYTWRRRTIMHARFDEAWLREARGSP